MEQQSTEWFEARLGVLTAGTCFKTVMYGQKRGKDSLLLTKAAEVLSGEWQDVNAAPLNWGRKYEPVARGEYEFRTDNEVEQVGLIYHPESPLIGCSPDGFVGGDGGIEIKCPQTSREHVRNILHGMDWKEYGPQVQGVLWITGRQWIDFVSYDPRMPTDKQIKIQRIERDEEYIAELSEKVWVMADQLQKLIKQVEAA